MHELMSWTPSSFPKKSPILKNWTGCRLWTNCVSSGWVFQQQNSHRSNTTNAIWRLMYLWHIWHGTFCENLRRQLWHRMGEPYTCKVPHVSPQEFWHKDTNHQDCLNLSASSCKPSEGQLSWHTNHLHQSHPFLSCPFCRRCPPRWSLCHAQQCILRTHSSSWWGIQWSRL